MMGEVTLSSIGKAYEAGADAIYPFAFEQGRAEGKREVIREVLANDLIAALGAGSGIWFEMQTSVGAIPAVAWDAKEPGYLCFIPIKMKEKPE